MARFTLREEGMEIEIEAEDMDAAQASAQAWAREGDYDTTEGTVYVDVWVLPHDQEGEPDDDEAERVTVALDQPEPRCVSPDGHDWRSPHWLVGGLEENPGVWGKDGMGVLINEACLRCGCLRRTDTGAQRHDTGARGFREVTYDPAHYDVPAWDRQITAEEIAVAAEAGACDEALEWLAADSRTVGELHAHAPDWYDWARRLLTPVARAA